MPLVPLATEAVSVQAVIEDEAAVSAQVRWWLGGVEQAPVAMTAAGGLYTGVIPAQADGAQVRFRVEAVDSAAQTELSRAEGYYSGLTPIAAFQVNDAAGVLVPKEFGVRIQGNMTVEPGIFHPFVSQI